LLVELVNKRRGVIYHPLFYKYGLEVLFFTASLKVFPAENLGTFLAGICIGLPV
jgi:hypothetical protein